MFLGRVVGTVWSTVKWTGLEGIKLLLVQPYHYEDLELGAHGELPERSEGVVVADNLDAGVGDTVVVAYGHAARVAYRPEIGKGEAPPDPIDAAVVAVVDSLDTPPPSEWTGAS